MFKILPVDGYTMTPKSSTLTKRVDLGTWLFASSRIPIFFRASLH
jgi:hypothetical protein